MSDARLLLDFDGVLVDSTAECFVVALLAWAVYRRGGGQELPSSAGVESAFGEPRVGSRWEFFSRHRAFVRWPREYWLVMETLEVGGGDLDQLAFDRVEAERGKGPADFQDIFLRCRRLLSEEHRARWLDLYTPQIEVIRAARGLSEELPTRVLTGRDRDSVFTVLESVGWSLDEDQVFDATRYRDKKEGFAAIQALDPLARFALLDDNIEHLRQLADEGVFGFWATWGYVHPESTTGPEEHNIRPVAPHDWTDIVRRWAQQGD